MTSIPWILAAAGFVAVFAGWAGYLAKIPSGAVPKRPTVALALTLGGAALAVAGVALGIVQHSAGVGLYVLAGTSVMLGLMYPWLYSQRNVPLGELRISVGEPMLAFETQTSTGESFSSADLRGQRVLLKFFRGSW